MHCYFILAGQSEIPVIYHVERVRSGRSFATRTVQARQRGNAIFTTTMSFVREGSGGVQKLEHTINMPYVPGPDDEEAQEIKLMDRGPIASKTIDIYNSE